MAIVQIMRTALVATAGVAAILLAACGDTQVSPVSSTTNLCVDQTAQDLRVHITVVQERVKQAALTGDASVAQGALRQLRMDVRRLEDC